MLQFALLAMQAAGMVTDWYATQQEKAMGRMGESLTQAAINSSIATSRAQAEDQSLIAMQKLRQTIGSQIAIQTARGTQAGVGSSLSIMKSSETSFNEDERARRMNLLANENNLRASSVMSSLNQLKSETQLGQKLSSDVLSKFSTDPKVYSQIGSNLRKEWGSFTG